MESSLISVLPDLGISVVAVLCMTYTNHKHLQASTERENALRAVEREVRTSIMAQLAENTAVMKEVVSKHKLRR